MTEIDYLKISSKCNMLRNDSDLIVREIELTYLLRWIEMRNFLQLTTVTFADAILSEEVTHYIWLFKK